MIIFSIDYINLYSYILRSNNHDLVCGERIIVYMWYKICDSLTLLFSLHPRAYVPCGPNSTALPNYRIFCTTYKIYNFHK